MSKRPKWDMTLPVGVLVPLLLVACCGGWYIQLPTEISLLFHQRQWANHHIASYRFSLEASCYCGARNPTVVEVRDGVRISPIAKEWEQTATVEQLFTLIQHALTHHYSNVRVEYDRLGYPAHIDIDPSSSSDDETSYSITGFGILP